MMEEDFYDHVALYSLQASEHGSTSSMWLSDFVFTSEITSDQNNKMRSFGFSFNNWSDQIMIFHKLLDLWPMANASCQFYCSCVKLILAKRIIKHSPVLLTAFKSRYPGF